jgi:hypothetical protein
MHVLLKEIFGLEKVIDNLIFENLNNKFTRELAKGNLVEAEKVVKRLENLYQQHTHDSLGTMIYFTVRGMKALLKGRQK